MKFKLDENLGSRIAKLIAESGHDAETVVQFSPRKTSGIAVLRPPRVASMNLLMGLVRSLLEALGTTSIAGQLWVVESGRIRVYDEEPPEESEI